MGAVSMKTKIIFICVAAILLTIFLYIYVPFMNVDDKTEGNTISNINNDGLVCKDGENIFYSNFGYDWSLHQYNMTEQKDEKLLSDYRGISDINAIGDWIYYIPGNPGPICRINKLNHKKQTLTLKKYYNLYISGKYIYAFESIANKPQKLYRMNLKGKFRKIIATDIDEYFCVYNDLIYFSKADDNFSLYSCDLNGNNLKKTVDKPAFCVGIINDSLYYIDDLNKTLFKNNLMGTSEKILYIGNIYEINISKNIFFKSGGTIVSMSPEGNILNEVEAGSVAQINVIDNILIYHRPVQENNNHPEGAYFLDMKNGKQEKFSPKTINVFCN